MANDVRINVSVTDNASPALRKVGQETDKVGTSASGTGSSMLSMGVAFAAVTAAATVAAGVLYSFYSTNRDLELQLKKSTVVFAEQLPVVKAWADSNAAAMGLSSNQATNLAASMADLLIPMGMTRDAATQMATKTIGLSGALAEWSGGQRTAAEVASILQKAFLGETDGLKELGIAISAEQVVAELAKKGQEDLTGAALEQAKALAIQKLVFEKSTDAQDAYAGGAGTAARAQAELTARMVTAHEQMSTALAPVIAAVSGALIGALIPAIDGLVAVFKFLVDHGTAVATALGGIGTAITVLMVPKLILLIGTTWAYVAALTAQAIAFATANPLLAVAAIAAGVAAAAAIALALRTGDAAVATSKMTAASSALTPELYSASTAAGKAAAAFSSLSFSAMVAKIATDSLRVGTGEYEAALPGVMDQLARQYEHEAKLKAITDALTESFTHENAIQAGVAAARKADIEAAKEQAFWLDNLNSKVANAIAAYEKLAAQMRATKNDAFDLTRQLWAAAGPSAPAAVYENLRKVAVMAARESSINVIQSRLNLPEGDPNRIDTTQANALLGEIPKMAHGGIVRARPGGTLAMLGEGGRDEAVIPLGGAAGGMSSTINVYLSGIITDPVATGRAVAAALNSASRTTGPLLLAGTVQ